ncbi:hypothetical protein LINGRAHAP2_LOCUS19077 [Linum grandiflorum]
MSTNQTPNEIVAVNLDSGDKLGMPRLVIPAGIPPDVSELLRKSRIIYRFKEQGWLLVEYHHYRSDTGGGRYKTGRRYLSCFNPSLPWPSCFIALPNMLIDNPDSRITAAFSASPTITTTNFQILVFRSGRRFSTVRIHPPQHDQYEISGGDGGRIPVSADFAEGRTAKPPLTTPANHYDFKWMNSRLRAVGETLVVNWVLRSSLEAGESLYRLESVVERNQIKELEEGRRRWGWGRGGGGGEETTVYLVGEDPKVFVASQREDFDVVVEIKNEDGSSSSSESVRKIKGFCAGAGLILFIILLIIYLVLVPIIYTDSVG